MKKALCSIFTFLIAISSFTAYAEDFTFDIYDACFKAASDDAVLMEIDEDVKKEFGKKLMAAWKNMDTEVQLYPDVQIHKDDIVALYSTIFFENPQYYYVVRSFSGTTNSAGYMGKLTKLKYNVDSMDTVRATWNEIDKATEEILFNISPDMTDFEKVMTVHDYMDLHYVYDLEDTDQTYQILLDKRGVCAAYAEAFQHVMNVLDIDSTLVQSDEMGHIWNMVKLDGQWYHADVTWDDPVPDQFAEVCHEYMLLSENAIKALEHYGFTAPYEATSTTYDNAPWHDEMCALVTVGGILYRAEGNNLIDENGNVIYEDLDGGDNVWNTKPTAGVSGEVFTGLCEINGVLYFNTDTGIYSYNPKTKKTECVKQEYGVFGLYADKNVILYSTYDFEKGLFVKKGELKINDVRVAAPYYEEGEAVIRLYNDCDAPLWVISEGEGYMVKKVENKGFETLRFKNGDSQTIYVWKNSLEPLIAEFTVAE